MGIRIFFSITIASLLLSACSTDAPAENETKSHGVDQFATMQVYKSPRCGCCGKWQAHMQAEGFANQSQNRDDMAALKADLGIPPQLQSCHTSTLGGYVFEGHIPAEVVRHFLAAQPNAKGLSVPGMPAGSPGMEMGGKFDDYAVFLLANNGELSVYAEVIQGSVHYRDSAVN